MGRLGYAGPRRADGRDRHPLLRTTLRQAASTQAPLPVRALRAAVTLRSARTAFMSRFRLLEMTQMARCWVCVAPMFFSLPC